jgi:hypothetical protein
MFKMDRVAEVFGGAVEMLLLHDAVPGCADPHDNEQDGRRHDGADTQPANPSCKSVPIPLGQGNTAARRVRKAVNQVGQP